MSYSILLSTVQHTQIDLPDNYGYLNLPQTISQNAIAQIGQLVRYLKLQFLR